MSMLRKKVNILTISLSLLFLIFTPINTLSATTFYLKDNIIDNSAGLKTECFTSNSQSGDYCKTYFFSLTLFTGGKFGQLSVGHWRGTDDYDSNNGRCGFKFNGKNARGEMGYIGSSSSKFTACYLSNDTALTFISALLTETRFDFYAPNHKGKVRGENFYTSDLISIPDIVIAGFIHHLAVSAKRTSYSNAYFGHTMMVKASPWKFAKILAKFKYYDVID